MMTKTPDEIRAMPGCEGYSEHCGCDACTPIRKQFSAPDPAVGEAKQNPEPKGKSSMFLKIAAVSRPTQAELEQGTVETIIVDSKSVVADSQAAALVKFGVENAADLKKSKMERLQIIIQDVK